MGNGDVVDGKTAIEMMRQTGCDFVMIGRGALGNPWIFREAIAAWKDQPLPEKPSKEEKKQMMLAHLQDLADLKGETVAIREMRKHVGWYIKGIPGAAALRGRINQITEMNCLIDTIREL